MRLAFRQLLNRPGFTAVAVLTLALGIGANTAVFTVIHTVLLNPLPYDDPSRVVTLFERTTNSPTVSVTKYNYADWRARSQSFSAMGAVRLASMTVTGGQEPERVPVKMLSASLLPLLGVSPAAGRGFSEDDDKPGAPGVVLLSDAYRERRFGNDDPIGRTITLDNGAYSVVGVLPPRFELFAAADLYVPIGPWIATQPNDRGWHAGIIPIARLKPGVSIEAARAEMDVIARQLETEHPASNRNARVVVTKIDDQIVQNVRPALLMLLGAVAFVLLIACANIANLLLARAVGRQKEIAVRTALGASRARLMLQLITESVVLASLGGAAGLLLGWWGISFLSGSVVTGLPRSQALGMAWPVALFTIGLAFVTGVVFGLVPALQATRFDIRDTLSQDGRGSGASGPGHQRLRSALVIAEIALALVLLVGAGLLLRSFATLTRTATGFDPVKMLVIDLPLSPFTYRADAIRTAAVERVVDNVRALPGVRGAAATTMLPMAGSGPRIHFNRAYLPPRGPDDYVMAGFRAVSADYLATMGVPLRRGRFLTAADRQGAAPVVVINESMAKDFFPDRDPLGERIQLGTEPSPGDPQMEIVGVVGDVMQAFDAGSKAEMYVPYAQYPDPILAGLYRSTFLVVRTAGAPEDITASVRSTIHDIDPNQPLVNVRTMERAISNTVAQPRLQTTLLTIFASVAAVLAVIGVYGVMSYSVSQRTQEIGVRLALGASPRGVVRMVVWQGTRVALVGIAIGVAGSLAITKIIERLLFKVPGWDARTFVLAALGLGLAAVIACYVPARRAARIAPVTALGR
ncbi:MAG TPA: ABC transporter permease [Vicinamibacterales bacterium]|nr:ABC transporter permease [Vicinamibacterales bacterium]